MAVSPGTEHNKFMGRGYGLGFRVWGFRGLGSGSFQFEGFGGLIGLTRAFGVELLRFTGLRASAFFA